MLRTSLALAVAATLISGAASAADLPSRRAPPVYVPPPPVPVFTWTGFYVGANAGYAFNGTHATSITGNTAAAQAALADGHRPGFPGLKSGGFTGGGQIGYNYQLGNLGGFTGPGGIVVGVEADAAYTDLNKSTVYAGTGGRSSTISGRTDYLGTVRGRVGYAFDRFLVYGTGGFAYGGVNDSAFFSQSGAANTFSGGRERTATGYTYGGGVEYAIPTSSFLNPFNAGAVTLKAEYLHYDLGTSSYLIASNNAGIVANWTARPRVTGGLVRAGINYKFGGFGGGAPVVARY